MKKLLVLLSLLFASSSFYADVMKVHKTDGTTDEYEITSDVNITFSDVNETDVMKILKTDNNTDVYNLSDVIVISFSGSSIIDDVNQKLKEIPISLLKNYPNPFNPSTNISFDINRPGLVKVTVYNQKGEVVKELLKKELGAGSYNLNWNGKNNSNQSVSSGFYFTKVSMDETSKTNRMILIK